MEGGSMTVCICLFHYTVPVSERGQMHNSFLSRQTAIHAFRQAVPTSVVPRVHVNISHVALHLSLFHLISHLPYSLIIVCLSPSFCCLHHCLILTFFWFWFSSFFTALLLLLVCPSLVCICCKCSSVTCSWRSSRIPNTRQGTEMVQDKRGREKALEWCHSLPSFDIGRHTDVDGVPFKKLPHVWPHKCDYATLGLDARLWHNHTS